MQLLICEGMLGLLCNDGAVYCLIKSTKILPNNAGILTEPADTTIEGYDNIFGVNDARHALLSTLLPYFCSVLQRSHNISIRARFLDLAPLNHAMIPL